ncbi:MAG: VacB/RNase II family 3'-5' exoribonuclease, partial [Planctomycetes bacterium]|nr:VacB/RNase II family 3'-5' exoribonuclease [Planctomycetota bacterium]
SDPLLAFVGRRPGLSTRQLFERFRDRFAEESELRERLREIEEGGELIHLPAGGWDLARRTSYRVGTLRFGRDRSPRVRSALPGEGDISVQAARLKGYLDGDRVLVRLTSRPRGGRLRGVVAQLVERTRRPVRGVYRSLRAGGVVHVDPGAGAAEIQIAPGREAEALDGDRVLVRLLGERRDPRLRGEVVTSLQGEGTLEIDLAIIREEFDLPGDHDEESRREAESLPRPEAGASWPGRRDLRGAVVLTIDPKDAEDFDDAVSLDVLEDGSARVGVHIADVSHYVRPGSLLDQVAAERGTSVYLPGRVIPMLPETLSCDLCSLRGGEDRLTITVEMTFSQSGELLRKEIYRSVIHSRRRFDYEEVQAILDRLDGGGTARRLPPDHEEYSGLLARLRSLRGELRRRRAERGALAFDIPKVKILLAESGDVDGVSEERQDEAHELVEELMLAANEAVARYLNERGLPVVGRVHPAPGDDRWGDLQTIVRACGFRLAGRSSQDFQRLIADLEGSPLAAVVQVAMLRAMGHAEYSSGLGLHFALATESYCHFTSPIRRYPDLLVHQIISEHIDGALREPRRREYWQSRLPPLADRLSELERRAEGAERAMVQLRLVRRLESRVGEEMVGEIHGIHPFGFFVHVPSLYLEGLVPVGTLGGDFFEFDERSWSLQGSSSGRRFRLGDRVRVVLSGVDPEAREISFQLAGERGDVA